MFVAVCWLLLVGLVIVGCWLVVGIVLHACVCCCWCVLLIGCGLFGVVVCCSLCDVRCCWLKCAVVVCCWWCVGVCCVLVCVV